MTSSPLFVQGLYHRVNDRSLRVPTTLESVMLRPQFPFPRSLRYARNLLGERYRTGNHVLRRLNTRHEDDGRITGSLCGSPSHVELSGMSRKAAEMPGIHVIFPDRRQDTLYTLILRLKTYGSLVLSSRSLADLYPAM